MNKIYTYVVAAAMVGVVGPVMAADFGSYKDNLPPPSPLWTGYYAGLSVGYGFGSAREDINGASASGFLDVSGGEVDPAAFTNQENSGFLGGVQGGYNWQACRTVIGLEADFDWTDISGSTGYRPATATSGPIAGNGAQQQDAQGSGNTLTSVEQSIDWLATFRARAGYLPAPNLLLFITGGLALGDASLSLNVRDLPTTNAACPNSAICSNGKSSGVAAGYVLGGGLEYMVTQGISLKGEYLYADLGSRSVTTADTGSDARTGAPHLFKDEANFTTSIARVGLNFKLGQ